MKIRDVVDVVPQPTVVRLDQLQGAEATWISGSYYITAETGNHLNALRVVLSKSAGSGIFLIGHYGSGKSHFLAYVAQQLNAGKFIDRAPQVVPLSLLNYQSSLSLESILIQALEIPGGDGDRRHAWQKLGRRYPKGLLLMLDELSEFLRSKPTPQSFNEDLRFLQFLGEWAQEHPLWIVAALQEQIEHTGEIEYDLFRKIKDRYPVRLLLTAGHIKDLIAQKILRKGPDYAPHVEELARVMKEVYPEPLIDYAGFCELYPLHPATLELLDEVRDRFSQTRGIVDFALTRLLGNEARGLSPFLDNAWGDLLTPDAIVDHFADLFEVQPEFLPISQKILPYYRKHMEGLFEADVQRELAWRLLKLLILVHLSPRRDALTAEEAGAWLMLKVSRVDPARNLEVIRRLLDTMCSQGSFLKKQGARYALDLQDGSREQLEQALAKEVEEIKSRGDYVFELLVPFLRQDEFNPFTLPRDRWHRQRVRWHFHEWDLHVFFGGGVPPEQKGLALQVGLPWGEPANGRDCYRLQPARVELSADILEFSALHSLKERPLPGRVLKRIQEKIAARGSSFSSLVRAAYHDAALLNPDGTKAGPLLTPIKGGVAAWLTSYGEWMLRKTYPQFERFAPTFGPLPNEAHRQLMKFATENDLGAEMAPEFVKLIREAYLLPMGLMQRRGSEYAIIPKLENHDLVRLLTPILGHHPTPARIYQHLSSPVYGLVPDQIQLLLTVLLIQGEIDIVKGDLSYRDHYQVLSDPLQYDRVLPGQALGLNQLRDLQILCEGFHVPLPKHWTVLAQKRAIEQLRRFGRRQRDLLSELATRLRAAGEGDSVAGQIEVIISKWLTLEKGDHELQGFEHFMYALGHAQQFVAEANEMSTLPARYEKLLRESQRFRHLFTYPCIAQCANPDVAVRLEKLGAPPPLEQSLELENWLAAAQESYRRYTDWYRKQHEQWRSAADRHPIWNFRAPGVADSRHVGASRLVREIEMLQEQARKSRCAGLVPLEFQPMCRCGFDGAGGPLDDVLRRFDAAAAGLEQELRLFFQQDKVKSRIRDWVDQKIEVNPKTLSYLENKADYPDVTSVTLFDQHLAGLELTREVDPEALLDVVSEGVWDKPALMQALDRFLDRFGPRIVLRRREPRCRKELAGWCCEQALKQGRALPAGFSAAELAHMTGILEAEWVGEAGLRHLEELGLDESAVQKILGLLLDGAVPFPAVAPQAGPVAAAAELMQPRTPANALELAGLAEMLYGQHERFMKLKPKHWLGRLQELAGSPLPKMPEPLAELLSRHVDAQWIVVDCLGLPLLNATQGVLASAFPAWRMGRLEFGRVSERSSTEAFYLGVVGSGLRKGFNKVNAVDNLIHERNLSYSELLKLGCAELEIAFRSARPHLDPAAPVVIFGDHGLRLAADGSRFTHGGPSTLERIVPVFVLSPL